jgi:hypothetical protein
MIWRILPHSLRECYIVDGFAEVVGNLLPFAQIKHNPSNVVMCVRIIWPESIAQPVKQTLKQQQSSVCLVAMT